MRIALLFLAFVGAGIAIGVGLKQASSTSDSSLIPAASHPSAATVRAKLSGAPAPLAALHAQADVLLPGGQKALEARLRGLRGHPVVVNVWASWCGPCNEEAPVLQHVALEQGRRVAFIGIDLKDNAGGAKRFMSRYPMTYPSYEDPDGRIFDSYKVQGVPSTVFYDAAGRQTYVHQGPYLKLADLRRDITRYAGASA